MDGLDGLTLPVQQFPGTSADQWEDVFQTALEDLAGSFLSEEDKGDPLSSKLADLLNPSLRRRPSDDNVKATAAKIKLPDNIGNFKVPVTNKDITQAMTTSGKLLDARLTRTNGILSKAIVLIARLLSDVGEERSHPVEYYLSDLNSSLRLLTAAFNYLNQIKKIVARIHVNDTALAQLCGW